MKSMPFPRCKIVRMHDGLVGHVMLAFKLREGSGQVLIHPSHIVACSWHVFGCWELTTAVPPPHAVYGQPTYHVVDWPEDEAP